MNKHLTFEYNWKDITAATTLHFQKKFVERRKEQIITILICLLSASAWWWCGFAWIWPALIGSPVIIYVIFMGMVLIKFRQEKKFLQGKSEIFLNDDDIVFKRHLIESKMEWKVFQHLFENSRVFILYYGDSLFITLPKKAFADKQEQKKFREFFQCRRQVKR